MECSTQANLEFCTCSNESCALRGACCKCIQRHIKKRQLPGCCFPADAEATYDRSFEHFAKLVTDGKA